MFLGKLKAHKLHNFIACLIYSCGNLSLGISYAMLMRPSKAETAVHSRYGGSNFIWYILRGNTGYHVAIVPYVWPSDKRNSLLEVALSDRC